jgi:hypothetical protein
MHNGKIFRPDTLLHIFIVALAIFILGVQLGIKHGRELQLEDLKVRYGYEFSD